MESRQLVDLLQPVGEGFVPGAKVFSAQFTRHVEFVDPFPLGMDLGPLGREDVDQAPFLGQRVSRIVDLAMAAAPTVARVSTMNW